MTDPLKLADKLNYEGGSLVLHTTDDVGETIHRISIPAELAAAALRLSWLTLRVEDDTPGVGGSHVENAQSAALDAFRAAVAANL